ncbi:hypothetical protein T03_7393 [Trichinella britovi]|uniref:Uncharacterized protein n=1 Tax=Trichinella britovi TaxID=45882 RepID=A0A0V0YSK0_TRIBR|nr:hypothetical protein T03_7393 [Trichinella britovi]
MNKMETTKKQEKKQRMFDNGILREIMRKIK